VQWQPPFPQRPARGVPTNTYTSQSRSYGAYDEEKVTRVGTPKQLAMMTMLSKVEVDLADGLVKKKQTKDIHGRLSGMSNDGKLTSLPGNQMGGGIDKNDMVAHDGTKVKEEEEEEEEEEEDDIFNEHPNPAMGHEYLGIHSTAVPDENKEIIAVEFKSRHAIVSKYVSMMAESGTLTGDRWLRKLLEICGYRVR
jgi:hypothetical protein